MPETDTAEYWRARAEESRSQAAAATNLEIEALLLDFARDYETIAEMAELQRRDGARRSLRTGRLRQT